MAMFAKRLTTTVPMSKRSGMVDNGGGCGGGGGGGGFVNDLASDKEW